MTAVFANAILTADVPLYDPPDSPVLMVNVLMFEPNETPEIVLLISEELPILVSVFVVPLIVLLVSVCVPVSVATTVVSIAMVPDAVIVPPVNPVPAVIDVTVPVPETDVQVGAPDPELVKTWPLVPTAVNAYTDPLP